MNRHRDGIPKKQLNKVGHHVHSTFTMTDSHHNVHGASCYSMS